MPPVTPDDAPIGSVIIDPASLPGAPSPVAVVMNDPDDRNAPAPLVAVCRAVINANPGATTCRTCNTGIGYTDGGGHLEWTPVVLALASVAGTVVTYCWDCWTNTTGGHQ